MKVSKLIKNKNKRKLVNENELKYIFLKFFISWLKFYNGTYTKILSKLYKLIFDPQKNKAYFTSIKNICLVSGRTRSVISMYKMSRICFNQQMDIGYLPGWKKASW